MNKKLNSKRQAGTTADSDKKPKLTKSSHHIAKPHVVCSQSPPDGFMPYEDYLALNESGTLSIFKIAKNQKLLSIAFEINKEFNKYNLSLDDAEKVMNKLSSKCFIVNKNKCIRDGSEIFIATMSASPL